MRKYMTAFLLDEGSVSEDVSFFDGVPQKTRDSAKRKSNSANLTRIEKMKTRIENPKFSFKLRQIIFLLQNGGNLIMKERGAVVAYEKQNLELRDDTVSLLLAKKIIFQTAFWPFDFVLTPEFKNEKIEFSEKYLDF